LRDELEHGLERGWPFTILKGKRPVLKNWTNLSRLPRDLLTNWVRHDNIGLFTGHISGLAVLDIDLAKGAQVPPGLPNTVTVETGGGGLHLYFTIPEGMLIPNSQGRIAFGVDVRGEAGQVVFPGSIHPDTGRVYRWKPGYSPDEIALAFFPNELLHPTHAQTSHTCSESRHNSRKRPNRKYKNTRAKLIDEAYRRVFSKHHASKTIRLPHYVEMQELSRGRAGGSSWEPHSHRSAKRLCADTTLNEEAADSSHRPMVKEEPAALAEQG
jgi:hypothetical protein